MIQNNIDNNYNKQRSLFHTFIFVLRNFLRLSYPYAMIIYRNISEDLTFNVSQQTHTTLLINNAAILNRIVRIYDRNCNSICIHMIIRKYLRFLINLTDSKKLSVKLWFVSLT